jgi:hypothetical protein
VCVARYEAECNRLLQQFNTLRPNLERFDFEAFFAEYGLKCPQAKNRLISKGVPATVEHAVQQSGVDVALVQTVVRPAQPVHQLRTSLATMPYRL